MSYAPTSYCTVALKKKKGLKRGRGYVLTYDLYTWKFFKAQWSAAVLKLSHEL